MCVTPTTSVVFTPKVIFKKSISCLALIPDVESSLWIVKKSVAREHVKGMFIRELVGILVTAISSPHEICA